MLRAVSQVFFFFKDKLRQCQPISNLHCSFLLPLKYEIIHCVANCWEEGTNVMWITLNTDLERDSAVKESLEAGGHPGLPWQCCHERDLDWDKLLVHVGVGVRAKTSTGAAMDFLQQITFFSLIWLAELFSSVSNLTSFSGRGSSSLLWDKQHVQVADVHPERKNPTCSWKHFHLSLQSERPM